MAIKKIKIQGAVLELATSLTALPIRPIWPVFEVKGWIGTAAV